MRLFDIFTPSYNGLAETDGASVTSTFTAATPPTQVGKAPLKVTKKRPLKKTVRFNLDSNVEHAHTLDTTEVKDLWYQDVQMRMGRDGVYRLARRVKDEMRNRHGLPSYQETMDDIYAAAAESSSDSMKDMDELVSTMRRWAEAAPERLGLEYLTVRSLKSVRASRREQVCALLRKVQKDQSSSPDEKAEYLRRKMKAISRHSRVFAYHTAKFVDSSGDF